MSKNMPSGSDKSSTESTSKSSVNEYLASFRQSILKPSTLPQLQTLLTLPESLGGSVASEPIPRSSGLFEALIRDPRVLFYDLLDRPDSYEKGVYETLLKLLSGKKLDDLTAEEKALLNRAVLDNAQPVRQKATSPRRPPPEPAEDEKELEEKVLELPDAPTFWWRQKLG